jgi:hypothetical protein
MTIRDDPGRFRRQKARHYGGGGVCGFAELARALSVTNSVAEPHHFDAAPAPTLLYSKAKFF